MGKHVTVNRRCANVRSESLHLANHMENHSFNFVLQALASVMEKKNVGILNNSPFLEETQNFICFCQPTVQ